MQKAVPNPVVLGAVATKPVPQGYPIAPTKFPKRWSTIHQIECWTLIRIWHTPLRRRIPFCQSH